MTLPMHCPGSKSMTQRALILAALSAGRSTLGGALVCDDSSYLTRALTALGVDVRWDGDRVEVHVSGPLRGHKGPLFCGNGGTAVRFGTCLGLLTDSAITVDGDARMRTRPIGPLGDALRQLGAGVTYGASPGYPPIRVEPPSGPSPGRVDVDGGLSSQFASGLLMVAPRLPSGMELHLRGRAVSRPYLDMTVAMMRRAGADVAWSDERTLTVAPGSYEARSWAVEADWSTASFLLAAGFITGRRVEIPTLVPPEASLQGDADFAHLLARVQRGEGGDFDLTHTPDLLPPLAAAALFGAEPIRIRGAEHTRVKESDRISVLARGLAAVGATVREHPDGLDIEPLRLSSEPSVTLDPAHDHRMAMAFGLVALRHPGVTVKDPECVSKSFPGFWDALDQVQGGSGGA